MGTERAYIRLSLSSKFDAEEYRRLETIMIIRGEDFSEFISNLIRIGIEEYGKGISVKGIMSAAELNNYCLEKLGFRLTVLQLQQMRAKWKEGVEYYVAPNGGVRSYRYDISKCWESVVRRIEKIKGLESKINKSKKGR